MFRLAAKAIQKPALQRLLARPGFRKIALRSVCEHPEALPADEVPGMIADMIGCTMITGFLDTVTAVDSVPAFTIPARCHVRIVWPVKDRTIGWKNYGQPMVDAVPGAEVVRVTGVGHVPMGDDPAMVVRSILEVVGAAAPG